MKLEDFSLTQDPFPIVPDGPVYNWAGRDELRDDLVDIVKGVRARDIGITEFVVLHGEYGAGKSHALRFLKTMISRQSDEFRSLAVYLERPRVASKLNFLELHRYILRDLGREKVRELCLIVKQRLTDKTNELAAARNMSDLKNKDSFFEQAVNGIREDDRPMARLLARGADEGSRIFEFLSAQDKCDGDEYEGKVDSDFMAAKVLSDLFRVLTSNEVGGGTPVYESVYLFIDEAEVLAEAKTSESELVFNGLRELINSLPYRFCLMLSFSAATALIEAIMPNHLLKRITREYVEIPMLSDDDAVGFLRDQINFYRPPGSAVDGSFYPFSEEAITEIISRTIPLTPRNLFINCKRVLERAVRRFQLAPGEEIERDVAEKVLGNYR